MQALKEYEKQIIRTMMVDVLSAVQLDAVIRDATFDDYDYTKVGYFLTVAHPILSKERVVCDKPCIMATAENVSECSFIIYLENNTLTIECHSIDGTTIPADYRDRNIQLK